MNNCELMMFLNALSVTLSQGKTKEELAFLSLVFSQLSTNFALLSITPPGCSQNTATEQTVSSPDEAIVAAEL